MPTAASTSAVAPKISISAMPSCWRVSVDATTCETVSTSKASCGSRLAISLRTDGTIAAASASPVAMTTVCRGNGNWRRRPDAAHAWNRAQTIEQISRPRERLIWAAHTLGIGPDVDHQAARRDEAGIRIAQTRKALHEPSGAGDEHQRERDLGDCH